MAEHTIPPQAVEDLIAAVRRVEAYRDWDGFTHPFFVQDELDYKRNASQDAQRLLALDKIPASFAADEDVGGFLKTLDAVAKLTNILATPMGNTGTLTLGGLDANQKRPFCEAMRELLHGSAPSPERLERFQQATRGYGVKTPWSFATYFLFLLRPENDILVRPNSTSTFLKELGLSGIWGWAPTAAAYAGILEVSQSLLAAMRDRGAKDLIDIQSFIAVWSFQPGVWKVAADRDPEDRWPMWHDEGVITIGWEELGDVGRLSPKEFEERRNQVSAQNAGKEGWSKAALRQVWQFAHGMKRGDWVVANHGMKRVLAVGRVTGDYEYLPDTVHGHRRAVEWVDLSPREVSEPSWRSTLLKLPGRKLDEILRTPPDRETPQMDSAAEPDNAPAFAALMAALRNPPWRLYFPAEVVANYLLALQTKRFVVLSGISGTGKTKLAQAVAAHCAGEHRVQVVPVRPDWTDNRGLLGFYNPLTQRYVTTDFLELLRAAGREPEHPFFVILDEMNLARVEHYFSDFLSCLESGEPIPLHDQGQPMPACREGAEDVPASLAVPPNVFFTGTVNVDETTYMFSPKVIDRAFTLELNEVRLERLAGDAEADACSLALTNWDGRLAFASNPDATHWAALGIQTRATLMDLHTLLQECNLHFGYRVANEIGRFVTLAAEQAEPDAVDAALDLAILQKVLPKFHGTRAELQEVLEALFSFAIAGRSGQGHEWSQWRAAIGGIEFHGGGGIMGARPTTDQTGGAVPQQDAAGDEGEAQPPPAAGVTPSARPRFPRTAAKVRRMLDRLTRQGFTAYME